ncbi:hypothetical protein ASE61_14990 [Bosea sp. Root670]|nr:hypothetical protein ASE61_14990 [Bosea sp. Root670]
MLVGIAVALTVAAFMHLWQWLEPACSNEQRRIIMKAAGGVGCFEFWLNRYQTTIQTIISSALAGAGLFFVLKQLKELGQQNKMTRAALEADTREKAAARRLVMARAIVAVGRLGRLAGVFLVQIGTLRVDGRFPMSFEELAKTAVEAHEQTTEIFPALETTEIETDWTEIEARMNSATSYITLRANGYAPSEVAQALSGRPIADDNAAFAELTDAVTRLGLLREKLVRMRRHITPASA